MTLRHLGSGGRVLFKLREGGVHLVPRVCVGYPDICLGSEPAWIIQARRSDRNELRHRVRLDQERRAALVAKTPVGFSAHFAWRRMEVGGALDETEGFRRHYEEGGEWASAGSLAIPTVTMQHHHWGCGGFIADRAASATAGNGRCYCGHCDS